MAAGEVVAVIKAINEHVTLKYSAQIASALAQKAAEHQLFQRELFDEMDQAVQKLMNQITGSLGAEVDAERAKAEKQRTLREIQRHCQRYNVWKKGVYDGQLLRIHDFEHRFAESIRNTLALKVSEQHQLFDTILTDAIQLNLAANQPNVDGQGAHWQTAQQLLGIADGTNTNAAVHVPNTVIDLCGEHSSSTHSKPKAKTFSERKSVPPVPTNITNINIFNGKQFLPRLPQEILSEKYKKKTSGSSKASSTSRAFIVRRRGRG